jgi:hypothetical protein
MITAAELEPGQGFNTLVSALSLATWHRQVPITENSGPAAFVDCPTLVNPRRWSGAWSGSAVPMYPVAP